MTNGNGDKLTLIQLLPNMITVTAIVAGLTAIRFGLQGNYELAVQLILLAAILDGVDGRLARALQSDSKMGAELDSLADFLNFGVAPGMLLYVWALDDTRQLGWLAVLVYAICAVTRLARFNVARKAENGSAENAYFMGIPSPAGAILVMLPMYASFAFDSDQIISDVLLSIYIAGVGFLMIGRFPVWSFKTTRISQRRVKVFLVGFAAIGAAIAIYTWIALVVLSLIYIGTVIWMLPGSRRALARDK
ncbi:CDP-diacylglycerol--serine O-phosphatidyltransferase [Marivita hallyeonensis]|uniref:CDP-diacylglycerol--serine O-phosphatidyltransferase n=1 Tax=Marivita hallyeonensis TaxID=996342 RepID=A0A1M5LZJ3_9RHOB|nr:CDP-diacylglycerol--serine O-phosphatidyltransferase [Marivita hallyeonensis]SHG69833.1 CDP-diacylglycerol---serine O-phosphatidyltransferase [Marivita hallyeonensis]